MKENRASQTNEPKKSAASRRDFLKTSAVVAAGAAASQLGVVQAAYAGGSDVLRVGLVGCGGRGTGAAAQTLTADKNTKLVAMADVFLDHLESSLANLKKTEVAGQVEVDADHQFIGFDAYKQLIASDVDIVLLATPPHFRPEHFKACIDANKHTFVEKPVAVDAPGIRSVLATTEEARKKNLTVLSGLCWRYESSMQEMVAHIHEGGLGEIGTVQANRFSPGIWSFPRKPEWSDLEYQMRNWYYFTWLSGDFNTEQFVHELDNVAWVLGDDYPVRCICLGGRQTRIGDEYGHIYDHFSAIYEYANGVKFFASTRHQRGCTNENAVYVMGTEGTSNLRKYEVTGKNPWQLGKKRTVMHQLEHNAMYAALRKGEILNNGEYMAKSTMMAIIARMSAYTGQALTWEQAMNSEEKLGPDHYDWSMELPEPQVAMPGITPFV